MASPALPHTNGVVERFFGSVKYEDLYGEEITDGIALAAEAGRYLDVFNRIRPHQELGFARPMDVYLRAPG